MAILPVTFKETPTVVAQGFFCGSKANKVRLGRLQMLHWEFFCITITHYIYEQAD